jgi:hypothetical protein
MKVKEATDKIRARGGDVVFVRTPSSGLTWEKEQQFFPRDQYWDKILSITKCKGIYFMDYPETDHFICPEFSHLTPADAIPYTRHLAKVLREEMGWRFAK